MLVFWFNFKIFKVSFLFFAVIINIYCSLLFNGVS